MIGIAKRRPPLNFIAALQENPVIAAFRNIENIDINTLNRINTLFILGGTIFDLPHVIEKAKKHDKLVFVDIDLLKGIGKDASGVRFLAKEIKVDGIITTRSNLIKSIQKEGLVSIQRMFVLDSESLTGGLSVIQKSKPDALEILPGMILPKVMGKIRMSVSIPVIAGGLITSEEEIHELLSSGAVGISTSSSSLFSY
jgi:glycerol uptake operon antiterminator